MYHHVKKLMFTVRVDEPDPHFGNMLLEQFGGANGELAAAMQYSIQGLNCEDPERKDLLMDIGTEELSHLEIVGTLARLHLAPTKFDRESAEADPLIAIAGGGGVNLFNSQGNPWTADYLKITGELDVDLRSNIAAEARAKIVYERLINFCDDAGTKDALRRYRIRGVQSCKPKVNLMSEFDIRQAVPQKQESTSSQSVKGEIADAGAEISQRARDALRASKDVARDKFKEASGAAAEVAEGASDHFRDKAQEQQRSGADIIDRLAGNIRQAAHAFENDAPFAARGINSSADYVEDAAEKIRNGTFRDLVDGASDFAKRQPAAFLGLSVLTGFAAVRFFRASEKHTASSQQEDV